MFCEGGDRLAQSGCHVVKSQRHVTTPPRPCVNEDVHRKRPFLHFAVPDLAADPCLTSSRARRRRHCRVPQAVVAWGAASGVPFLDTCVLASLFIVGRSLAVVLFCVRLAITVLRGDTTGGWDFPGFVGHRK